MNEWLSGKTASLPPNGAAGTARLQSHVSVQASHHNYIANNKLGPNFGLATDSVHTSIFRDRIKMNTHRKGISSSFDNSISSAVLRNSHKSQGLKKDIHEFGNSSGINKINDKKHNLISKDIVYAEKGLKETVMHETKSAKQQSLSSVKSELQKRKLTSKFENCLAKPSYLTDWLEDQMADYKCDLNSESRLLPNAHQDDVCIKRTKSNHDKTDNMTIRNYELNAEHITSPPEGPVHYLPTAREGLIVNDQPKVKDPLELRIRAFKGNSFPFTNARSDLGSTHSLQRQPHSKSLDVQGDISSQLTSMREESMVSYICSRPRTHIKRFEYDARRFTHFPFYKGINHFSERLQKWPSKLQLAPVELRSIDFVDNVGLRVLEGCTCIRFDALGALVAVSSSNGVVRVFDFDEVLAALHGSSSAARGAISPVVSTAPGPAVTDVQWSLMSDNELAVAFAHRSDVYVYDLYRCQNSRDPLCILRTVRGDSVEARAAAHKHGGNKVLRYIKRCSGLGIDSEGVVAGSQNGCIRFWNLPATVDSMNIAKVPPAWEISSDMASQKRSPIIGLCSLGPDRLVSASACGTFAVWDLLNIADLSFGKQPAPALLVRVAHSFTSPLTGLTLPLSQTSHTECHFYVTMCTGSVHEVCVSTTAALIPKRSERYHIHEMGAKLMATPQLDSTKSSGAKINDDNEPESVVTFDAPPCVTLRFGPHSYIVSSYPHKNSLLNKLHVQSVDRVMSNPEYNGTLSLEKADTICLTLPGSVIEAEPGQRLITVSHDLRQYLCSELVSRALKSRSYQIILHWSSSRESTTCLDEGAAVHKLDGVDPHSLHLQEPYHGPPVSKGDPHVKIRTNLAMTQLNTVNSLSHSQQGFFVDCGAAGVTAFDVHPQLPYLLVGTKSDDIHVMSPTSNACLASYHTDEAVSGSKCDVSEPFDDLHAVRKRASAGLTEYPISIQSTMSYTTMGSVTQGEPFAMLNEAANTDTPFANEKDLRTIELASGQIGNNDALSSVQLPLTKTTHNQGIINKQSFTGSTVFKRSVSTVVSSRQAPPKIKSTLSLKVESVHISRSENDANSFL